MQRELEFNVNDDDRSEMKSDVETIIEDIGKTIDSVGVYIAHKVATGMSLGLIVTIALAIFMNHARKMSRNRRLVREIWGTETIPTRTNAWNAFQEAEGPVTRRTEMRANNSTIMLHPSSPPSDTNQTQLADANTDSINH